ncbi:flagellar protein FliT [Sporosarcina jeotgali]|uniref:Flagellar protein FliT n=1 Tax=Sporosarcina jeotgali TaxID=3020056 RepID=A0ABZ0L1F1_9BACL|nr:flagellar protein FliT [Sporosarcina sp. B2O-1]WOV85039.1 flagellar protein FliT [Sporosarcina sp. B2O-1]
MIRPELVQWKDATERMLTLSISNNEDQRDIMIASIEAILDEREKLQPYIQPPFSSEEEVYGKELVAQELKVAVRLESYLNAIRKDLSTSQTKKDSVRSYVNPYSKVARDGTFYDTKQ